MLRGKRKGREGKDGRKGKEEDGRERKGKGKRKGI